MDGPQNCSGVRAFVLSGFAARYAAASILALSLCTNSFGVKRHFPPPAFFTAYSCLFFSAEIGILLAEATLYLLHPHLNEKLERLDDSLTKCPFIIDLQIFNCNRRGHPIHSTMAVDPSNMSPEDRFHYGMRVRFDTNAILTTRMLQAIVVQQIATMNHERV